MMNSPILQKMKEKGFKGITTTLAFRAKNRTAVVFDFGGVVFASPFLGIVEYEKSAGIEKVCSKLQSGSNPD